MLYNVWKMNTPAREWCISSCVDVIQHTTQKLLACMWTREREVALIIESSYIALMNASREIWIEFSAHQAVKSNSLTLGCWCQQRYRDGDDWLPDYYGCQWTVTGAEANMHECLSVSSILDIGWMRWFFVYHDYHVNVPPIHGWYRREWGTWKKLCSE